MTQFLKPAEGRSVYQMDGSLWPEGGMDTETSLFVRRRLKDGDLILAQRPAPVTEAEEPADEPDAPKDEPEAPAPTPSRKSSRKAGE